VAATASALVTRHPAGLGSRPGGSLHVADHSAGLAATHVDGRLRRGLGGRLPACRGRDRLHQPDHLSHTRLLAGGLEDLRDPSRRRGGQFDGRLVALDLDDSLVDRHAVAFLLLPGADLDLGDRFTDLGNLEFYGHERRDAPGLRENGRC